MAVQANLLPSHSEKTLGAMKAERTVKRITFNPSEANPGETLYVSVPKLSEHEVVSGSLALVFNINLSGGHANNYLVQNVSRALVDKLAVKFATTTVHDMDGYHFYKIFEDLFLSVDGWANMLLEGIQSEDLCKICSGVGNKKNDSSVDVEKKLESIYKNKYRINPEHQILMDHGVFYPQALYNDLVFELTLAPAAQVVRGSDPSKLVYKLENIQLEYETIKSKSLADEATSTYNTNGKEFAYDLVMRDRVVPFQKGTDTRLNLRVNPPRRSLKGILLLFITPYTARTRDSENYLNPGITKVKVTVNGVPNRVYNKGTSGTDVWREISRLLKPKPKSGRPNMDLTKYLTGGKFGLFIDLRSMADTTLHGNGQRLVNTGWCATRDRKRHQRLGTNKLPHLHHRGLTDEHHGPAAGIGSVLGTHKPTNIERHGPKKAAPQRLDRGAHQLRQDIVCSYPAAGGPSGDALTTLYSSAPLLSRTRPTRASWTAIRTFL